MLILLKLFHDFQQIIQNDSYNIPTEEVAILTRLGALPPPYELQWRKVGSKWVLFSDDSIDQRLKKG